jgi:hypothetical protein
MNARSWATIALLIGTSIGALTHHIVIGATAGLLVMALILALGARRAPPADQAPD